MRNESLAILPNLSVINCGFIQKFPRRSGLPNTKEFVWEIKEGIVRSFSWREDGTIVATGIWGPGDMVGYSISHLNPYSLECLTSVEAIPIPVKDLSLKCNFLIDHIHQLEALLNIRSCKRVEEMVIELLKLLSEKFGYSQGGKQVIDLRLTHQDIADLLGTTRVTITRILQKLEENGCIERTSIRKIILKDVDGWYYQI